MKNVLCIIMIMMIVISGCITRKACNRRFPSVSADSIKEISTTLTRVKDTTIYIQIPETTFFKVSAALPGIISKLDNSFSQSEAWISDGLLKHRLIQNDTNIPVTIPDAIKTITTTNDKVHIRYVTREVNKLTWWQQTQIYSGKVMLILLLLFIIYRILAIRSYWNSRS